MGKSTLSKQKVRVTKAHVSAKGKTYKRTKYVCIYKRELPTT